MHRLVMLCTLIALLACSSAQTFRYRGTVAAGESAGWTFDETQSPGTNAPLPAVAIVMYALGDQVAEPKSDAQGKFDTFEVDVRDGITVPIRLTFEKAGYQRLEYVIDSKSTTDPRRGERFMNVVLQPE